MKQIFRQVETLNRYGIRAFVLLDGESKQQWFETDAPIAYSPYVHKLLAYEVHHTDVNWFRRIKLWRLRRASISITADDILVFPEIYGAESMAVYPENKRVIFNQNCYYTYNIYDWLSDPRTIDYSAPQLLGTIVVSEDSREYLSYAFPSADVYRMHIGVQHRIFQYCAQKKRQLCYMPRKLKEDSIQILSILKQRGHLAGWDIVPIDGKSEEEVAQIMGESVFFLSFNHREGFGLPPVEAMSCGCYVIGYHGEAGREYMKPEFSTIIETGDILGYARSVEELVAAYDRDPQSILEQGKLASDFVREAYSMERQDEDTIQIWQQLLAKIGG